MYVLEPLRLYGEGQYSLSVLKDIQVTESFLGLDAKTRECQNDEPYDDCMKKNYVDEVSGQCSCLPFGIQHLYPVCSHNEPIFCLLIAGFSSSLVCLSSLSVSHKVTKHSLKSYRLN